MSHSENVPEHNPEYDPEYDPEQGDAEQNRPEKHRQASEPLPMLGPDRRISDQLLLGRKILQLIRQSTDKQVEENTGSYRHQEGMIAYLKPYGVTEGDPRVVRIEALGESGKRRELADGGLSERAEFEAALTLLATGEYGILLVAFANRLARNQADGQRLIAVLRRHRIILMVGSRVLDVRSRYDKMQLTLELEIADMTSSEDAERLQGSRFRKTAKGEALVSLPTGLVAADPRDPEFRRRMEAAGLSALIDPATLATHKVKGVYRDRVVYVFVNPDPVVLQCLRCLMQWIKETRSVAATRRRVAEGYPGWPPGWAGMLPLTRHSRWHFAMTVRKMPVSARRIREWLSYPALYGTFAYDARTYRDMAEIRPEDAPKISLENAFPALGTLEDFREIRAILQRADRNVASQDRRGVYHNARNHALRRLSCNEPNVARERTSDTPCCLRLGATYDARGDYFYFTPNCFQRYRHKTRLSPVIETEVLRIARGAFGESSLERALQDLDVARSDAAAAVAQLTARITQLEGEQRLARQLAAQAAADGQAALASDYTKDYQANHHALEAAQRELRQAQRDHDAARGLSKAELNQIKALVRHVPALLDEAEIADAIVAHRFACARQRRDTHEMLRLQALEGHVRRVLDVLEIEVRAHILSEGMDAGRVELTVAFATQASVTAIVDTAFIDAHTAERACAAAWLDSGQSAEDIATRLSAALAMIPNRCATPPCRTAADVHAMAAHHRHTEEQSARIRAGLIRLGMDADTIVPEASPAQWKTVAEIAALSGEPLALVDACAVTGLLGRLHIDAAGTFRFEATPAQIHDALREYARRCVAKAAGWSVRETRTITELSKERGDPFIQVYTAARRGAGLARDDAGCPYTHAGRTISSLTQALDDALAKRRDLAHLDRAHWTPASDARQMLSLGKTAVCTWFTSIRVRFGRGRGRIFVWLDPAHALVKDRVDLPTAVTQLGLQIGGPLDLRDFISREFLVRSLGQRGLSIGVGTLMDRINRGCVWQVNGIARSSRGWATCHVYAPAIVRTTHDRRVVTAWLNGELNPVGLGAYTPPPPAVHPASPHKAAEHKAA